ncbi:MAG: M1 family metallopeptidase [Bacteroidota bacterium]
MRRILIYIVLLLLFSCEERSQRLSGGDPHSYAVADVAWIKHMNLDMEVDFEEEQIKGKVIYEIEKKEGASEIWLDTKGLTIEGVQISSDGRQGQPSPFELGSEDQFLGKSLKIQLEANTRFIHIDYKTNPGAEALQFLPKELTADKKAPFLLTQSQAILARSWVPIQDSPALRFTYKAKVKVPKGLMAVMSASNPQSLSENGAYEFRMEQPIPGYLLALAVGDFSFKPLGDNVGVYAEASVLDAAAEEFSELPEMIRIAEELYGSYEWDRYDVIVLPPSFPFGGMENPRITFVTPTVLAGDKSLVSLLAHELAHSWSGNLVTNASWNDFWLNEGFTTYFENRIMEELKGKDYAEMLAHLSYQSLSDEYPMMVSTGFELDSRLALDLNRRNPDDGMTSIAYDKGFFFLKLLEESVGRKAFDSFLRKYFSDFAFKTMDTDTFVGLLKERLLDNYPDLAEKIRLQEWIYEPGIPDNIPFKPSERFVKVEEAVNSWIAGVQLDSLKTENWTTHEWLHFIRTLPTSISPEQMAQLDAAFSLSKSNNSEIQALWYKRAIEADYEAAYPYMEKFLVEVGRRKFLLPLYRSMIEQDRETELAREIYAEARSNYHPISVGSVDQLLKWTEN